MCDLLLSPSFLCPTFNGTDMPVLPDSVWHLLNLTRVELRQSDRGIFTHWTSKPPSALSHINRSAIGGRIVVECTQGVINRLWFVAGRWKKERWEEEYWAEDRIAQKWWREASDGQHQHMRKISWRFCLMLRKCSISHLIKDEHKKARGLLSPSRPWMILQEGSEETTASTPADAFSAFVRLAKHISCVSLPRDDTFAFVLAFSECPRIVSYLRHICKLRYRFDVTACTQRCADIPV